MTRLAMLLLAAFVASAAAARDCTDFGDGSGLLVTAQALDASVSWMPRFAGRAGESELVFLVTKKASLYISYDDGISWKGPLNRNDTIMPPATIGGMTDVTGIHFTALPKSHFYVTGTDNGKPIYWTTRDGGRVFDVRENDEQLMWFLPHPTYPDVALAFSGGVNWQRTYLTTDLGASWVQVGDNTTFQSQFGCDVANCTNQDAIFFQNSAGEWDDCLAGDCVLYKQPFDRTRRTLQALGVRKKVFDASNGLTTVNWPWYDKDANRVMFTSSRKTNPRNPENVEVVVYYSTDLGVTWDAADFPFGTQPHYYRFITTESEIMLAGVRSVSASSDQLHGTLYVSSTGLEKGKFAESLRHVRMTGKLWWENSMFSGMLDVERSAELDGVFLANRYRSNSDGSPDLSCLQTVLTMDYGSSWNKLTAPTGLCKDGEICNLHVRLNAREVPTAYSPSDAVGVWLAQGHVGECLSTTGDVPFSTYYSADAGKTWVVMSNEPAIYEVSNHGALVAGAVMSRPTNELIYTLDDGRSWNQCEFMPRNITVNNILTRSFNAKNFLMEGRNEESIDSYGIVVHLGFKDVHDSECKEGDYVNWSPADCLLGKHVVWKRRKIDAKCHNPVEHEITSAETPCECTEADYECDFCYEWGIDGKCRLETTASCKQYHQDPSAACFIQEVETYYVTDGYRLQPSNQCKGGVQHGETKQCPDQTPRVVNNTPTIVAAVLAVGALIAIILGVTLFVYMRRRKAAQSYGTLADSDDDL